MINSVDDLLNTFEEVEYLLFYGNALNSRNDGVTKACFSQWYRDAPFTVADHTYPTAEHYMMAGKASLFGDDVALKKIWELDPTSHPSVPKKLGREVKNFRVGEWEKYCRNIVMAGNLLKFTQNPKLGKFLLSTGDKVLVEASPYDKVWGIGLSEVHPHATNPVLWKGENKLGFALMRVRDALRIVYGDHFDE